MGQGNFTEDFRIDAVKQVTERGHSVADVSKRLGVSTHSLYAWMKRQSGLPVAVVKEDQSAEIRRLKQELARVTEERDILKNRSGFLARLCAVETACASIFTRRVAAVSLLVVSMMSGTPLKNVAHELMRT